VRGLNERYTNSTLNGSIIPSPEPLRKVAPLDLFPTSVLESTLVQKTFSPDMSAEFGGGSIDIRTRAVPTENFFEIGGSLGANTEVSFQDGLLYDGSDTDALGFDDGKRDLPSGLAEAFANGNFADLPQEEQNALSRAVTDDSSLLVLQEGQVGPDFGVDLSVGRRLDINPDLSVGFLGAVSYSNDWTRKEGIQGIGEADLSAGQAPGPVAALRKVRRDATKNTIGVNGFASLGFDILDNHELKFVGFATRSTDKEAEVQSVTGEDVAADPEFEFSNDERIGRRETLEWIERQLWTAQVQGEHVFPTLLGLEADWRASVSEAERDAPFQVTSSFAEEAGELALGAGTQTAGIEFSKIEDEATDFGFDLLLPLLIGEREVNLKGGYAYTEKDRESQTDFLVVQNFDPASRDRRIDFAFQSLFADGTTSLQATRSSRNPSFYVATQETDAGYLGLDAEVTPFLRVAAGARFEDFTQVIETRSGRLSPGVITPPLEDDQVLPAATLTWNLPGFAEDLQLRVGYSETLNRPQFRELGPSLFTNTDTNEQFIGNPFLEITEIENIDARLEWYFGRDEFVTLGGFYKDLTDPIEAFNVGSGESRLVTFVNIDQAEIQGLEFELQKNIPVNDWLGFNWLDSKEFRINTNYTFSDSSIEAESEAPFLSQRAVGELTGILSDLEDSILVTLEENSAGDLVLLPNGVGNPDVDGIDAVDLRSPDFNPDRRLQGQSKHLANLQIGFADFDAGSDFNILVNYQSERIRSVESFTSDSPAIVERPPVSVDLVYKRDFTVYGGDYQIGLKAKNILGDEYEAFQESGGERVDVDVYDVGTTFSVSLKRTF